MDRIRESQAMASPAPERRPGAVRCDGDLVITDASLMLCRFLARRLDELVGQPLVSFVDADDLALLTGEVCRKLMGERLDATTIELHFIDRRGVARPARLTLTWLPDPDSTFLGSIAPLGGVQPGTDGATPPTVALAEKAPDLIWRLRLWPEPSFEYVSPSSEHLLGYPPSAFYGDPQLLANLASDANEEAKLRALYDGNWNPHEPLELQLIHRDGRVRAFEQRTTGVLDGERRVLAVEAISHDVTAQRAREGDLAAEVAVRHVLDEVERAEPGSDEPARVIQRAVDAICTEFGWVVGHGLLADDDDPEALISTHVWPGSGDEPGRFDSFGLSTDRRRWPTERDLVESSIVTGEPAVVNLADFPDNERARAAMACGLHRVFVVSVPVGERIGAALEFYTDDNPARDEARSSLLGRIAPQIGLIIERRREVESLRRMDEVRTEFVTRAAHELRGPVGSIAVMASALALEARRSGALDLTGSLDRLAGQAERIQLMATRLLALSQLEQGRLEVSLDAIVLRDAAEQAVGNLFRSTPPVTIEVDPDIKVLADPLILEELLSNLLANAERHGGPNVRIEAAITTRSGKTQIGVTVSDDGPGVDESLVPHLFEPLRHRLTSPTHSGLGLALVRQMAITLGGDAVYAAGVPQGARFTFFLAPA